MDALTDAFVPRRCSSAERLMWVTRDRVFYAGLLGAPAMRTHGAVILYVALEGWLRLRVRGGDWQQGQLAAVQPYLPYQVASEGRHVLGILVEPETVDMPRLPALLRACGVVDAPDFAAHVRHTHGLLVDAGRSPGWRPGDFDTAFFGQPLPARPLDARIAAVLDSLWSDPSGGATAAQYAAVARLSVSRFLHLFKEQAGAPFRTVRAWKRARSLLNHVNSAGNLADVALDIGYPDSTHFSHSIRQAYGLRPRDIFAGSRKLRLIA